MRTTQKIFILSAAVTFAFAGCGKSSGTPSYGQQNYNYNPWNTTGQVISTQQMQNCGQNMTQITDILGQRKCYAAPLAQACPQAGGIMVNQNLCRVEREIPRATYTQHFYYVGAFAVNVPMNLYSLQPGESVKVIGDMKAKNPDNAWAIELYQNGVVAATAKSGALILEEGHNVVLVADSALISQMMIQGQQINGQQMVNGQVVNGQVVNGQIMQQNMTMNPMSMQNTYGLRIYGRGTNHVSLKVRAIGCEDGKGNRYPCQ